MAEVKLNAPKAGLLPSAGSEVSRPQTNENSVESDKIEHTLRSCVRGPFRKDYSRSTLLSALEKRSSSPEVPLAHTTGRKRSQCEALNDSAGGKTTRKKATTSRKRTTRTPPSVAGKAPLTPPTTPGCLTNADISFYFFTSDENLGAIPAGFEKCSSARGFYDQALQALSVVRGHLRESDLIGVNVLIDALKWPLILPWRDPDSHSGMMENLKSLASRSDGPIVAMVKCIMETRDVSH